MRAGAPARRAARRRILVALAALGGLAGLLDACGGQTGTTSGPTTGRQVYLAQCSTCHGADRQGVAGNPGLPAARMAELGDAGVRQITVNGKNKMVGLGGKISGEQLDAVVAYLTGTGS